MTSVYRFAVQRGRDALPYLLMAAVAAFATWVMPSSGLALLALGPAFAAALSGPRKTVAAGVVALGLCVLLIAVRTIGSWHLYIDDSVAIAGVTLAGVLASSMRGRRERELADVRAIAEVAQQVLLGPVPREVSPVRMAVRYMSAASHARIGGDLYEVVPGLSGIRLIMGDVQGKGLVAVKTAATVLGSFREAAHDAAGLALIADRIELSLARQLTDEQFVTAVLAEVSADGSKIELLSCGHPPPLLISGGAGRFVEPIAPGLPLGLAHLATAPRYVTTIPFRPADQVLFYTDGVSEARDRTGAFYPLAQRAARSGDGPASSGPGREAGGRGRGPDPDPDCVLDRLQQDVLAYVGHALDDDAAMLLVSHEAALPGQAPARPAPPPRPASPPRPPPLRHPRRPAAPPSPPLMAGLC